MADRIIEFTAIPEQQRYYNEDSHWGVYVFSTPDDIPEYYVGKDQFDENAPPKKFSCLAGNVQRLTLGMKYNVKAVMEYNKKYKQWQYIPQIITSTVPKTQEDQITYLKTQTTERQAENILKVYPNVVDDIMNGKKLDYAPIKGIGAATWEKIENNIIENFAISDVLIMLQPLGITYKVIKTLLSEYKSPELLKQDLKHNPYILTRLRGMGFKRVDGIALKLKPDIKVTMTRTVAFVRHYLNSVASDVGDTWIKLDTLNSAVQDNIPECYEIYETLLEKQKDNGLFLCIHGDKVGLKKHYDNEMRVLSILRDLNNFSRHYNLDIDKGIEEAEKNQGFKYTAEQVEVIRKVCNSNVSLYTGKSGTGKSSILRAITTIYSNAHYSIACCALSAKAAQRISETTNKSASTIHRLLSWDGDKFKYNAEKRLPYDIIIVDESSMINVDIFLALLQAINEGSRIIMCGDDGQLPPIGEGNVFHDLLSYHNDFNCYRLTKILRQAEQSGIVSDAAKIRNNISPLERPELKIVTGELQDMTYMFRDNREGMRELAIKLYLAALERGCNTNDVVIITPCKQNRINSTFEINNIIQDKLIPKETKSIKYGMKEFRVGCKIIQRANNYDLNVFNGETGYVTDIFQVDDKNIMRVDFGNAKVIDFEQSLLAHIELAYALTCHLTQGSEYPNVICVIDNTHYKLLDSCLLYTAITRAKKKCLLIAEPQAFRKCITDKASDRNTWLDLYRREEVG